MGRSDGGLFPTGWNGPPRDRAIDRTRTSAADVCQGGVRIGNASCIGLPQEGLKGALLVMNQDYPGR